MSKKCAVACTGCDWAYESDDPYKLFIEAVHHATLWHKGYIRERLHKRRGDAHEGRQRV